MGTGESNAGGNLAMDWHAIQGGVEIFLVAPCHGNRDKLRPDGPHGSYADFTLPAENARLPQRLNPDCEGFERRVTNYYLRGSGGNVLQPS